MLFENLKNVHFNHIWFIFFVPNIMEGTVFGSVQVNRILDLKLTVCISDWV